MAPFCLLAAREAKIRGQPSPVWLGRDAGALSHRRSSVPERPPAADARRRNSVRENKQKK